MILTCPNCESRFLLPAQALGPAGRRVKCSNCGEIWNQLPDAEEIRAETEDGETNPPIPDIPESVKPIPDGGALPALPDSTTQVRIARRDIHGYASALALFLFTGAALVAARVPVVSAWPPALAVYDLMGLSVPGPYDGLSIGEITPSGTSTEGDAGETLSLKAHVLNQNPAAVPAPALAVTIHDSAGAVIDEWVLPPASAMIDPSGALEYTHTKDMPQKSESVSVTLKSASR